MERTPDRYAGAVRAPEFPDGLDWIGSPPVRLADLRGQIVLLDFWTSGCINCMHILPNLHRLERAFDGRLTIIGVHTPKFPAEKDADRLALAAQRLGIGHPVVSDPDYAIWQRFAVEAWPTLIFLDRRGRVVARHAGEFDDGQVHAFIEQLLGDTLVPRVVQLPVEDCRFPLRFPAKLAVDPAGTRLAIAGIGNHRIFIATFDGRIETVIGSGKPGSADGSLETATFRRPQGLVYTPDGSSLIVADFGNHLLRRIDLTARRVETIAGTGKRGFGMEDGPALSTALASPADIGWFGHRLLIAMAGTHQIWAYDPATARMEHLAGTGIESIHDDRLLDATFAQPMGLAALENTVFVADAESSAIRALDFDTGRVRRILGRGLFYFGDLDAIGDSVRLQHPQGIVATEEDGKPVIYLADTFNNKIKRVDPIRREAVTIAGTGEQGDGDGAGLDAEFREPSGLALAGRTLFIADTHNHRIRMLDLDRNVVATLSLVYPGGDAIAGS